ncbi:universal stress protein [Emticicia sp. 21SJ11W-3]|uniref:universal stress protein n=1 Tax=Emticicia sp. 21SJ11W-3 TaxID=2916755 RepID=UPI00209F6F48|nr:universal stress protein [Emticicia sp. 21SJ11W-3]UTA69351.1 universal stress protein [Emticicia sp. 21SJ11W-3]
MKKIVVATDFQSSSEDAFAYATYLAEQFEAELALVHVYFPIVSTDPNMPYDSIAPVSLQEEMMQIYETRLAETLASIPNKTLKTSSKLIIGSVSSGVSGYADEVGADLIVVGRNHESSFFERIIGSSASDIVKNTSIPVLIVPAASHKPSVKSIIYGTELESDEKEVLAKVFAFANQLKAKVTLTKINVAFEPDIQDDKQMLADIKESFADQHFSYEIVDASLVSEGLLHAAHKTDADLLVIARHHHNFLSQLVNPSKSKVIIGKTDIPLLVYDLEA